MMTITAGEGAGGDFDIELRLLLEAIYLKYQYDFRNYARASLRRRVRRALESFRLDTISALQDRVLRDGTSFQQLLSYLTVQVSDMFRDPEFFLSLRREIIPWLGTYPSPRIWVAGCAAGEEVYSLAILLHEAGLLTRSLIYATDINGEALRRAEAGIYDVGRLQQFSEDYKAAGGKASLSDYYTAAYDAAVFDRKLREHVVFTDHSLATDQVFAEVQLVTCRNVLIYFNTQLQQRALGLFHDALCPMGFLGLGARESLRFSPMEGAFQPYLPEVRIYRRT